MTDFPFAAGFVEKQLYVSKKKYGVDQRTLVGNDRGMYVWDMVMAGIKEFTEVLDCYDAKPWRMGKETHGQSITSKQAIAEELADVLIFLSNLALVEGITTRELLDTMDAKQRRNITRTDHQIKE